MTLLNILPGPFAFCVKDAIHEKLLLNGEVNFKQTATMTEISTNSVSTIEVKRKVTPGSSVSKKLNCLSTTQGSDLMVNSH